PCTVDTCAAGKCRHVAGPNEGATACPSGELCDASKGCVPGMACTMTSQCKAALGGDACKTAFLCDPVQAICTYRPLDQDADGHPPIICGGDDCNDDSASTFPGAPEICDGKDNDCNQQVDDGATCPGLFTCVSGSCVCPAANMCGAACVDR